MKPSPVLCALAFLVASPALALAASATQPLAIDIHANDARATQLPEYDPAAPISVSVTETGGRSVDGVSVGAVGPAGESIQMPLTRAADGRFTGTLWLQDSGSWRLQVTARAGTIDTHTAPVMLDVAAAPSSNAWQIGLAAGAAIFVIFGGSGFFALRRIAGSTHGHESARAA